MDLSIQTAVSRNPTSYQLWPDDYREWGQVMQIVHAEVTVCVWELLLKLWAISYPLQTQHIPAVE